MKAYKRGGVWSFVAPDNATSLTIGGDKGDIAATEVKGGCAVFTAEQTADLLPGVYELEYELADGGLTSGGKFTAKESIAVDGAEAVAGKTTHAERMVAALETLLETAAGSAELSISTADGTSMTFETRHDLRVELATWRRVLAKERGDFRRIRVLSC